MKRDIFIFIVVWAVALSSLVLYLNRGHRTVQAVASEESTSSSFSPAPAEPPAASADSSSSSSPPSEPPKYQCLGKTKCTEMTSCAEAMFYLQNCPGTKMDGDNDGVPCEKELCGDNGKSNYQSVYSRRNSGDEKGFSYSYGRVESHTDSSSSSDSRPVTDTSSQYQCLGKTRCTEMTSCAEAMFYLQNCPGTKMDGDKDGIPCEDQWCGH